jgi:hypothetical protein
MARQRLPARHTSVWWETWPQLSSQPEDSHAGAPGDLNDSLAARLLLKLPECAGTTTSKRHILLVLG